MQKPQPQCSQARKPTLNSMYLLEVNGTTSVTHLLRCFAESGPVSGSEPALEQRSSVDLLLCLMALALGLLGCPQTHHNGCSAEEGASSAAASCWEESWWRWQQPGQHGPLSRSLIGSGSFQKLRERGLGVSATPKARHGGAVCVCLGSGGWSEHPRLLG